ncbi:TrbG/VirB9 family P-type conjugative transfer protein [Anaerovibrio sp.]|uniref:TrbG/VirB9 family P-type conjugative transfer protein n=1 Tax=Anaerovibrio sp. TaxID=1872532 RepID=UPI00388EE890
MNKYFKKIVAVAVVCTLSFPCTSFAASPFDIFESKAVMKEQKAIEDKLEEFDKKLEALKEEKKNPNFDAEGAFNSLAEQLLELRKNLDSQNEAYKRIMEAISNLEAANEKEPYSYPPEPVAAPSNYYEGYSSFVVNPGPSEELSYTQDAINSQGNSTMIFRYAPNQLYKIYCRVNYLTDIALKKGEHLAFVGGGDTSAWAVNSSVVDGTTHIYIKPVVESSTTNLIITTDKHSYQLILNVSNWYNPMVRWSYDVETQQEAAVAQAKNDMVVTGTMSVYSPESLDFDYQIIGGSEQKPVMAFTDGEKTYIKFAGRAIKGMPPLFVRSGGKKEVELVNYRVKDNYYIVDKVIDMAEIRFSDKEKTIIKHK